MCSKKSVRRAVSNFGKYSFHKYWGKNDNNKKTPLSVPITLISLLLTHDYFALGLTHYTSYLTYRNQCKDRRGGNIKNCYDVSYIEKRLLCLSIYYYYYIVYTIQCYYIVVGCYNNGEFIFGLFLSVTTTTIYYYYIVYR